MKIRQLLNAMDDEEGCCSPAEAAIATGKIREREIMYSPMKEGGRRGRRRKWDQLWF
jgi:hypothetical protein